MESILYKRVRINAGFKEELGRRTKKYENNKYL